MPLIGRSTKVTIKDERNSNSIRNFSKAKLQLTTETTNPKLTVLLPPDNEIVCEFYLNDSNYVETSSSSPTVECFRIRSTQQIIMIIDQNGECARVFDHMRDYFQKPILDEEPGPIIDIEPEPINDEKINQLVKSLNEGSAENAARIARELALHQRKIQFTLDMVNEAGNAAPRPPPMPVVEPLKLKLSIESFLIARCTNDQYDIAVLPQTTIKDLKQIVHRDANIPPNQQYWYINRDHLDDAYMFGVTAPRVNENTVLTLFIAKPQNA